MTMDPYKINNKPLGTVTEESEFGTFVYIKEEPTDPNEINIKEEPLEQNNTVSTTVSIFV